MRKTTRSLLPGALFLLAAPPLLGGCEEYFSVDEACAEKISGAGQLTPTEEAALLRMNCYRRLAGVTKVAANGQVQTAARGLVAYAQQNPSVGKLRSTLGAYSWLLQQPEDPGFTGSNLYARLTGDPTAGGAGYVFTNFRTTGTREFVAIKYAQDPSLLRSGKEAVDELMRDPEFRQVALQPSVLDVGYAEGELSVDWFVEGGWFLDDANADQSQVPVGRIYYFVVLFEEPHTEHAASPVLFPKEDQTGVPLYSWSLNRNLILDGAEPYAPTQLSYPVTLLVGSLNPENFTDVDQNQYAAYIEAAAIIGPDGVPLPTHIVHPGDDAVDSWPTGINMRHTLSLYTRHPFEPSTKYRVMADLVMPDGKYRVDYSFRTAADDPGVDPTLGVSGDTVPLGRSAPARSDRPDRFAGPWWSTGSTYHPAGTLREASP